MAISTSAPVPQPLLATVHRPLSTQSGRERLNNELDFGAELLKHASMYPKSMTELAALIAAVVPLTIWIFSGLRAVRIRAAESRSQQWRRISELALLLYNNENASGEWAQMAAVSELGDVRSRTQVEAARTILSEAGQQFAGHTVLADHIRAAVCRLNTRRWWQVR